MYYINGLKHIVTKGHNSIIRDRGDSYGTISLKCHESYINHTLRLIFFLISLRTCLNELSHFIQI